ncbi:MAG: hypothetical protein AAFR98_04225 [Pseudomonadota bacterium]
MVRAAILLSLALMLGGCIYGTPNYRASELDIRSAAYVHDGPTAITLFTSVNNRSGAGAHSGLMINASERILYDPAGRFTDDRAPENADVHYGFSEWVMVRYFAHHTAETHHLRVQKLIVSPETAAKIYALARQEGRSVDAACATHVSNILAQIPELGISRTIWPRNLSDQFAEIPGVQTAEVRLGDPLVPQF